MSGSKALGIGLLSLGVAACQGAPIPLSAQRGSTILIPLSGAPVSGDTQFFGGVIAYGGTEVVDRQRGELVFRLDGPTGPALVTRGATSVVSHPAAPISRDVELNRPTQQVVAIVDIPVEAQEAPLGTHDLYIERQWIENEQEQIEAGPQYFGQIAILPHQIVVDLQGGGSETIMGAQTPFAALCGASCPPQDMLENVPLTVPDPEFQFSLSPPVWSVSLTITYPDEVIDVTDVFATLVGPTPLNQRPLVWFDDDGEGNLVVGAAAVDTNYPLRRLSVAFQLDTETSSILKKDQPFVQVIDASDANGNPLSTLPSVTAKQIY